LITGTIKNQVDRVWDAFWAGGVSNPLSVIEQFTYLLFARRLDDLFTAEEAKANALKEPIKNPLFGKNQQHLRWSRLKNLGDPQEMFRIFRDEIFPFIKELNRNGDSAYSRFMKDAVFIIPTPALLARVVDMISVIPMEDRDTKGDLYEYMLSKIATAGQNGQFRTPRHIIKMMVELVAPQPTDIIGDPACGTCGFLVGAWEYLREHHKGTLHDKKRMAHYRGGAFHGADFDASMLRIGAMNLMLHGIDNPAIQGIDSLSQDAAQLRGGFTLVLANPPFKGSLNHEEVAKDLLQTVRTKKTELLFIALFLNQLKPGGRCACIVPDGVLFGSSKAHQAVRQTLVDGHKLDGVISMPAGVFRPYAGVSTAVLLFTRTDSGGTDHVWFYDMEADGFSMDDKRDPVAENDIPDVLARWAARNPKKDTDRAAKAFFVPVAEIRANKYDLSINRYKEIAYEEVKYDPPHKILDRLEALEGEIVADLKQLRGLLL
jgi:type I restriction enzyme M protein